MASVQDKLLQTMAKSRCIFELRKQFSTCQVLQQVLKAEAAPCPFASIPGPKSLPVIGTLYKYLLGEYDFRKPYKKGKKLKEAFGDIVLEELLPGVKMVHLFNASDVQQVLKHEGRCPMRPVVQPLKLYRQQRNLTGGLATLHGEEWHKYRTHVQKHTLRPRAVASYLPAQEMIAREFIDRMFAIRDNNNEIPNFLYELYHWACESVGIVCFDSRLGLLGSADSGKQGLHFFEALSRYFSNLQDLLYFSQLHVKLQTNKWKSFLQNSDILMDYTIKKVDEAIDKAKCSDKAPSLLHCLLSEPSLTKDQVLVLINDLLTGGVDSTAHTMAFLLCNLAKYPDKQEKLRQEVLAFAPTNEDITEHVIHKMTYMKACLNESLRIMPSVPYGIVRILSKKINLHGYDIPAGSVFLAHTMVMGRDERYFEDADTYRPERWIKSPGERTDIHPFATLPFGFGPRMCVGKRFAEQEIYLLIIHLMRKFRVEYKHEEIGQQARTFMAPDRPLRFAFIQI